MHGLCNKENGSGSDNILDIFLDVSGYMSPVLVISKISLLGS